MSFIFKITTTTSPQTFVIPCGNVGTFNATVDYGDGTGSQTVTAYNDSNLTHSFATAGQHTITINGTFPNIRFYNNAASAALVDEVGDLGDVGWDTFLRSFRACTNLTTFNSGTANTSSITNMNDMFFDCSSLTSLDLSNFDTSSATGMAVMFQNCSSLTTLNLSNFDTSSVTDMAYMFFACSSLTTLDLSSFDTSSVTNMSYMFNNCSSLTSLNVSNFDTSSVTTMQEMFHTCLGLTSLDLSNFNTSSVTSMQAMFNSCSSLTALDLSSFDTSNITTMQGMFHSCSSLTALDIKHFDISSATNGTRFLQNANNALTTTAYDELLDAWAAQEVQPNVPWHFGNAQYTVETIADWYSPRDASSLSIINNKLVSIADSTAVFGAGQQVDNLIVGNVYKMKARSTCNNAAATMFLSVSVDATLSPSVIFTQGTSTALIDNLFTATATTMYFGVVVSDHAANDTVTIDAGITVKEITNYTEANAASEIEYSQENVFGSELVVNGNFATDLSGWNTNNAIWYSGRVYLDAVPTSSAYIVQTITDINKAYLISANLEVVQGIAKIQLGSGDGSAQPYPVGVHKIALTVWGSDLGTDGKVYFARDNSIAQFYVDNVSVKEITNAVEYKNIPQSARELYSLEDDTWVGSDELVVNGDFAADLSGWNNLWGTPTLEQGGLFNSKYVRLDQGDVLQQSSSLFDIKVGDTYRYQALHRGDGGSIAVGGANNQDLPVNIGSPTRIELTFTATYDNGLYLVGGGAPNTYFEQDNISVKKIIEVAS